jgi:hypothetical protein
MAIDDARGSCRRASGFRRPWARELDDVGGPWRKRAPIHRREEAVDECRDRVGLGVGAMEQRRFDLEGQQSMATLDLDG